MNKENINKYKEALLTIGSIDLQDYPTYDEFMDSNEERYPGDIPLGLCYHEEMETLQEAIDKAKAFDLIKNKKVDVKLVLCAGDMVKAYNICVSEEKECWDREELTQEEFDFLREMFFIKDK